MLKYLGIALVLGIAYNELFHAVSGVLGVGFSCTAHPRHQIFQMQRTAYFKAIIWSSFLSMRVGDERQV
jgi:hypothetical protein